MRDIRIDVLRFIGLMMVMLAHVEPPLWLYQIRNFDVPLMVLVAAMSFSINYKPIYNDYLKYAWHRSKRLLLPVWVFITLYFFCVYFLDPQSKDLNYKIIITSYSLMSGIGYVWIIRVFLLVSLFSPLVYKITKKNISNRSFFLYLLILFSLYEYLRYIATPNYDIFYIKIIINIFFYAIPYLLLFSIGVRITMMNKREICLLSILSLITFIFISVFLFKEYGRFVPTQEFKYPPSIYYFSYALPISLYLYTLADKIKNTSSLLCSLIVFVSRNSMWIYLWHIPMVKYIDGIFIYKYVCVVIFSILVVYFQNIIITRFIFRFIGDDRIRKNIAIYFTG